jgi:AcrR family transcriptional regulator
MSTKRKADDFARRIPSQRRAQETVAVIFEAAARILQKQGLDALNTNAIAERAGISIGTLYQYFPNKQAILVAMARRQIEIDRKTVTEAISSALEDTEADLETVAVRAVVGRYRGPLVRRVAMEALSAAGLAGERTCAVQDVALFLSERIGSDSSAGRGIHLSPVQLFMMTRAVDAVVRAAAYEAQPFFGRREFEDELVRLVRYFLDGETGSFPESGQGCEFALKRRP